VDDEFLAEQEQSCQLTCLEDRPLAVLAGNDQCHLERGPLTVRLFAEPFLEDELLPRVQMQASEGGQLDRFRPGATCPWRGVQYPRRLRSGVHDGR